MAKSKAKPKGKRTTSKAAPPAVRETQAPKAVKQSELLDRRMAAIALKKSEMGESPSVQESAALRRVERAYEEETRWKYYSQIPQSHWAKMSERQPKILAEQQERYGLPFGGAVINLPAVVKALHDFLAEHAADFGKAGPAIQLGPDAMSPETNKALSDGTNALEISRSAMTLASRRLHAAAAQGLVHAAHFADLKVSLGELRQAEQDYIALEETRGNLIARDDVKTIVGTCAARLLQCVVNLENAIATEFAVWLADPAVAAMGADERGRKVREFVASTCNEVRRQEAAGVEALIAAQAAADDAEEGK